MSEEQGKLLHQDIKMMERRYQRRSNINVVGDYCWSLHGEQQNAWEKKLYKKLSSENEKKVKQMVTLNICLEVK